MDYYICTATASVDIDDIMKETFSSILVDSKMERGVVIQVHCQVINDHFSISLCRSAHFNFPWFSLALACCSRTLIIFACIPSHSFEVSCAICMYESCWYRRKSGFHARSSRDWKSWERLRKGIQSRPFVHALIHTQPIFFGRGLQKVYTDALEQAYWGSKWRFKVFDGFYTHPKDPATGKVKRNCACTSHLANNDNTSIALTLLNIYFDMRGRCPIFFSPGMVVDVAR
jgi:hypothetical protein